MSRLTLVHLLMISVWMGLVLAETVIEFSGRHDDDLKKAAILHYRIDCFLEIPVVFAVLITGMILAARLWPLSRLLWIKMAMGLIAIAVNLYCAVLVILRYRRRNDAAALRLLSRNIYQAWIGIPFGMAAFYCGLKWMGMV